MIVAPVASPTSVGVIGGCPNWEGILLTSTVRTFQSLRATSEPFAVSNAPWPIEMLPDLCPSRVRNWLT